MRTIAIYLRDENNRLTKKVSAEVLSSNRRMDIAVLKVPGANYSRLSCRGRKLRLAEELNIMVFNRDRDVLDVRSGQVSEQIVGRDGDRRRLTAPSQKGNSGGPVLTPKGRAVGVVGSGSDVRATTAETVFSPMSALLATLPPGLQCAREVREDLPPLVAGSGQRRWGLNMGVGWSTFSAASSIRAEAMDFGAGPEIAATADLAMAKFSVGAGIKVADHDLDPPGIDFRPEGEFRLRNLGLNVRFCSLLGGRCGVKTKHDLFAQVELWKTEFEGDVVLVDGIAGAEAELGSAGPFEFEFTGLSFGAQFGYVRHLLSWLDFEARVGYAILWLDEVKATSSGVSFRDSVSGSSGRFNLAGAFVFRFPA